MIFRIFSIALLAFTLAAAPSVSFAGENDSTITVGNGAKKGDPKKHKGGKKHKKGKKGKKGGKKGKKGGKKGGKRHKGNRRFR